MLKPGDRIPSEKQLCQRFGVGRTSVREALRSLAVMGVLESHMGDGTFVTEDGSRFMERSFQWGLLLNPKIVENLVETRLMLESHTAYLAATRSTVEDLEQVQRAVRRMPAPEDRARAPWRGDSRSALAYRRAQRLDEGAR